MNKKQLLNFNNKIFIDYEESTSIKGLLMILIILGHNFMISNFSCDSMIFFWLYYFHVAMFFILPLYYGGKPNHFKEKIIKNLRRIYIPYIWFYVFSTCIYNYFYGIEFDFTSFIKGLIPLHTSDISNVAGVKFLWFVPVFFLYNIIVSIHKQYNYVIKACIIILSISAYLAKIIYRIDCIPLTALYYFGLSYIIYTIYNNSYKEVRIVPTVCFIILSILFFCKIHLGYLYYTLPLLFWGLILCIKGYIKNSSILYNIGKYSLPIYMIHFFINSIFERIFEYNLINGIISFISTISISYGVVYLSSKHPFYYKIFPR